jgi:hypothetical protein
MKTKNHTANPALKPRKKMEDRAKEKRMLDELRLLKQIVEEARSFCRPDMRERQERQGGKK